MTATAESPHRRHHRHRRFRVRPEALGRGYLFHFPAEDPAPSHPPRVVEHEPESESAGMMWWIGAIIFAVFFVGSEKGPYVLLFLQWLVETILGR